MSIRTLIHPVGVVNIASGLFLDYLIGTSNPPPINLLTESSNVIAGVLFFVTTILLLVFWFKTLFNVTKKPLLFLYSFVYLILAFASIYYNIAHLD